MTSLPTPTPDPKLPSEMVEAEIPSADEWKKKLAAIDDIAEELSLPRFGDFMDEDITPEMIRAATAEQVQAVETRVAITKDGEVGPIRRWDNREKTPLPLWYHLPHGKQVIKRLMICGRFSIPEIAQMIGLRERQLKDYLKGMGLEQDLVRLERAKELRKYREMMAEFATRGRMTATVVAFKEAEKYMVDPNNPDRALPRVNVKELKMLNEIFVANDPTEKEDMTRPGGVAPSINIGVKVTNVDRNHKPNQQPDTYIEE